jgi:eukaryotic-like serine/threonine-protein kinase
MPDGTIQLQRYEWILGERLGGGGFGNVFVASSPEVTVPAVAKLVPKAPGAERELLFVNTEGARNVVPVLDVGETDDAYVLVMERAEKSLRQHLEEHGRLSEQEAVPILGDVATTLADLEGKVVHRDLKPDNVLLLNGHWCLADFGIARYAEATTAENTRKFSMTPPYAAPEQWRGERITPTTDIYALGVMAYEMLAGRRPFLGPDFREQHLEEVPPTLKGVSGRLSSLVNQCLNKHPASRPTPSDVARRLSAMEEPAPRSGLERLQEAHEREVVAQAEAQSRASQAESARDHHERLFGDARRDLGLIASELESALINSAPSMVRGAEVEHLWTLQLGKAVMRFSEAWPQYPTPAGIPFVVHACAALGIRAPGFNGYEGRTHSLWYCDPEAENRFHWYELAFMANSFVGAPGSVAPLALNPEQGAEAITTGVSVIQLARNLTRLEPGELDAFIARWGDWLADASSGQWSLPSLPDETIVATWRGRG